MEDTIAEVLHTIGWDTGFRLPIANEENQLLERELAQLIVRKNALTNTYDDTSLRLNQLGAHNKYLNQQVQQNETLLATYRQQLQKEKYKLKLQLAERDKLNAEVRKIAKTTQDVKVRISSKRTLLEKNTATVEKLKSEVEWDAHAVQAWQESSKKRDADNALLEKFSSVDQQRIAHLENKRSTIQSNVHNLQTKLIAVDRDVEGHRLVLERTGQVLAQLKAERGAVVAQWQESVKNLHQKDVDVKYTQANIDSLTERIDLTREEVDEQKNFLEGEVSANKYTQYAINTNMRENRRVRCERQAISDEIAALKTSAQERRNLLRAFGIESAAMLLQIKQAKSHIAHSESRLNNLLKDMKELKEQQSVFEEKSSTVAQNAGAMQQLIATAEKEKYALHRELHGNAGKLYTVTSKALKLKKTSDICKAEVGALENAIAVIRKRKLKTMHDLDNRKQQSNDIKTKIGCLQAQIDIYSPSTSPQYADMWTLRIRDLEDTLAQHTTIKNLLNAQIERLRKENTRVMTAMDADATALQHERGILQTLCSQAESGSKQIAVRTVGMQQRQVAENLLRLKVSKLDTAKARADAAIYDSRRYQVELQTTLRERHVDIAAALEVLAAERRGLEAERGRLRADIAQRADRIRHLQRRYDTACGLLGKTADGQPLTVGVAKLQLAQEHYRLRCEGDALDKKIRKAEQEIVAMENTLKVVNITNQALKKSLTRVEQDAAEGVELKQLEDLLTLQLAHLKDKKLCFLQNINTTKSLSDELLKYIGQSKQLEQNIQELEKEVLTMEGEHGTQLAEIAKTEKRIHFYRKKVPAGQQRKYDRDLNVRQLQDSNNCILYQLGDFCQAYTEVVPVVKQYMKSNQLEMTKTRTTTSESHRTSTPSSGNSNKSALRPKAATNILSLQLDLETRPSTSKDNAMQ